MIMAENLGLARDVGRKGQESQAWALQDGSRIAVIGAGPAGSMFSYFFLTMAETIGLDVGVDMFEPRHFCHRGPAGCNHCGGVVSETLIQRLATEGIVLPDCVVQRGIESYTLHMDVGDVEIATPLMEKRIAAIYRGKRDLANPCRWTHTVLTDTCWNWPSRKVRGLLTGLLPTFRREEDLMSVHCADQHCDKYETRCRGQRRQ